MRFVLAVLAIVLILSPARAEQCETTFAQFNKKIGHMNPSVFKATPDTLTKMLTYINKNRSDRGHEPIDADAFVIIHVMQGNQIMTGLVVLKNGCLVPGMAFLVAPALWVQIAIAAGVRVEDFEPMKIGDDT